MPCLNRGRRGASDDQGQVVVPLHKFPPVGTPLSTSPPMLLLREFWLYAHSALRLSPKPVLLRAVFPITLPRGPAAIPSPWFPEAVFPTTVQPFDTLIPSSPLLLAMLLRTMQSLPARKPTVLP